LVSRDEYHALGHHGLLIHCAASLNRKSEKQCLNVNLRARSKSSNSRAARRIATVCAAIRTFPLLPLREKEKTKS